MIKDRKASTVKNPLTIIAIFAGIAEIGGTGVLPFIEAENQRLYIWFLILFPIFLVSVFFWTLNVNHRVLYAPSDWKNEDNFFRKFSKASADEQSVKLNEEVQEAERLEKEQPAHIELVEGKAITESNKDNKLSRDAQDSSRSSTSIPRTVDEKSKAPSDRKERYLWAERKGLEKLEKDIKRSFSREVVFKSSGQRVVFDGMAVNGDIVHVAEIKHYISIETARLSVPRLLERFRGVRRNLLKEGKKLVLHLVIVFDDEVDQDLIDFHKRAILRSGVEFGVNIEVHLYSYNSL